MEARASLLIHALMGRCQGMLSLNILQAESTYAAIEHIKYHDVGPARPSTSPKCCDAFRTDRASPSSSLAEGWVPCPLNQIPKKSITEISVHFSSSFPFQTQKQFDAAIGSAICLTPPSFCHLDMLMTSRLLTFTTSVISTRGECELFLTTGVCRDGALEPPMCSATSKHNI